jgi:hypothetical protein
MHRLNQGLPPTENAESEWDKIERKRARDKSERDERV